MSFYVPDSDWYCFQFLGIPPKGEHEPPTSVVTDDHVVFPISRDPPEGGTVLM